MALCFYLLGRGTVRDGKKKANKYVPVHVRFQLQMRNFAIISRQGREERNFYFLYRVPFFDTQIDSQTDRPLIGSDLFINQSSKTKGKQQRFWRLGSARSNCHRTGVNINTSQEPPIFFVICCVVPFAASPDLATPSHELATMASRAGEPSRSTTTIVSSMRFYHVLKINGYANTLNVHNGPRPSFNSRPFPGTFFIFIFFKN